MMDYRDVEAMKRVAEVMAGAARLNARLLAMEVANDLRRQQGFSLVYGEEHYLRVAEEEGVGYNQVVERLYHI